MPSPQRSTESDRNITEPFLRIVLGSSASDTVFKKPLDCFPSLPEEHRPLTDFQDPKILDENISSLLSQRDIDQKLYRTSTRVHAKIVNVAAAPSMYFLLSHEGYATYAKLEGYAVDMKAFHEGSAYSLTEKTEKRSTVILCEN